MTHEQLARAPFAYFEAVDRKDMDATLAFFTDDATFTVQSAPIVFDGKNAIRGMLEAFFTGYATIVHGVTNVVVDVAKLKVATEQTCPHIRNDGTPETVTTCNFFAVDGDGRFSRVIVWIDGVSPLRK